MKFVEAFTQVFTGSIIIFISNKYIFDLPFNTNISMLIVNTVLAFTKTYTVREIFNRYLK